MPKVKNLFDEIIFLFEFQKRFLDFVLRKHDGEQHENASENLSRARNLMKEDNATHEPDDCFHAHNEGCNARRDVLLSRRLQGESNRAGEDAEI